MLTIDATVPAYEPPTWAILQRQLLTNLTTAAAEFFAKYMTDDGTLIWRTDFTGRDGLDDAYESCYDWPLAYALGADHQLLELAGKTWHGVTGQFARYGHILNEYERGYDWFHQGEGNMLFYHLCLAEPQRWQERARQFADLYVNPGHGNYDPQLRLIRGSHNGSGGPRRPPYRYSYPFTEDDEIYEWTRRHEPYGLPYDDLPGIQKFADLKDPANARAMGKAMNERMARGDTAVNLGATGLIANAYLITGDERYRSWVINYVEAWIERAEHNGGILPDNVGLSGTVGEYLGGRWYGGLYGWAWPHGLPPIASAATVAGTSAALITGDLGYLDLPRSVLDYAIDRGHVRHGQLLVPHRHNDSGWFDYQPLSPRYGAAIWQLSRSDADWKRIEHLRANDVADWTTLPRNRGRYGDANTKPWLRFLANASPDYPARALSEAIAQVSWQLDRVRTDDSDLAKVDLHHWQVRNPVTTEVAVQLALGGPSPIYNGGLLHTNLYYLNPTTGRPGLPTDVAAQVDEIAASNLSATLVNLSMSHDRTVGIRGGAWSEHRFEQIRYTATPSTHGPSISRPTRADRPTAQGDWRTIDAGTTDFVVRLKPNTTIQLDLTTTRTPPPAGPRSESVRRRRAGRGAGVDA